MVKILTYCAPCPEVGTWRGDLAEKTRNKSLEMQHAECRARYSEMKQNGVPALTKLNFSVGTLQKGHINMP